MSLLSGVVWSSVFLLSLAGLIFWAYKASKDLPKPSEAKAYSKMSKRELKRRERERR